MIDQDTSRAPVVAAPRLPGTGLRPRPGPAARARRRVVRRRGQARLGPPRHAPHGRSGVPGGASASP
ncbi:hypothetical protein NKG05_12195 [Oerskovia sp. M15]